MNNIKDSPYSFVSFSKTATTDSIFRLTDIQVPMYNVNIHALSNNAYYGDRNYVEAPLFINDVAFFDYLDISDVFFKNYTAGSNTKIVAAGSVPVKWLKDNFRL